jgi:hypothetical protein
MVHCVQQEFLSTPIWNTERQLWDHAYGVSVGRNYMVGTKCKCFMLKYMHCHYYRIIQYEKGGLLVSVVTRRYQKLLLVLADLRQPIPISVLLDRYLRYFWYQLA